MKTSDLSHPVFLCGMMGAGKTTIGKMFAQKTGLPFHDLDHLIETTERMTIPDIFKTKGEAYFRETEAGWLVQNAPHYKGILSLGGGSLQHQQLVDHLKMYGWLVFLDAPASVLCNRLKGSKNRPMLNSTNLRQRIETLLEERRSLYEQAHITIKSEGMAVNEIVNDLIKKVLIYEGRN